MEPSHFDRLRPTLVSMGMAFAHGENCHLILDPEKTILDCIPLFHEDIKAFRMLISWCEKVSMLIHIERLAILSSHLDPKSKIILGALSRKLARTTDRRWSLVERKIRSTTPPQPKFDVPEGYDSEWLIHKYGVDADFKSFGIMLSTIEPSDSKKILTLPGVIELQPWLKVRALIGPNFRADLIYCIGTGKVQTSSQASKMMACSRDTAWRLWREVKLYPELAKIVA